MPAIQPDLLKKQTAALAESLPNPAAFISQLHDLLDFYADRTRRPGQAGTPPPLLHSYRAPQQVLRQILQAIQPLCVADFAAAGVLADSLWLEQNLECRLLAIEILAWIPPTPPEEIEKRIITWAQRENEEQLLQVLLVNGISRLRQEAEDHFLQLVKNWLKSDDLEIQKLALRSLPPLIKNPGYTNLPHLFQLLNPVIQRGATETRPFLLDVVHALAERSPQETAYFLRQGLPGGQGSISALLIRKTLHLFPKETQDNLRIALRSY
jgi:hypothetical protein